MGRGIPEHLLGYRNSLGLILVRPVWDRLPGSGGSSAGARKKPNRLGLGLWVGQ
jgi:hypothetical protein